MDGSINWGFLSLACSLIAAVAALIATVFHAAGRKPAAAYARALYLVAGAGIAIAVLLLLCYFIVGDFRFAYVYGNSSRDLELVYRIAAFWSGKEGSFLLWLLILNVIGLFILRSHDALAPVVMAVIILAQVFILLMLAAESPFRYIWHEHPDIFRPDLFPGDGAGLNPLLRDPWMVAHPPVLFLGYASAAVPFGYAVAGLLKGERDAWVKRAYPWLLFSTATLGTGIFLGGYWAYSVLGWGGYWGWDPVENSSLIPWLAAVGLVHGFLTQRRHGALPRTNALLAIIYFLLVICSAWLTRSGALANFSVHSFSASSIGAYLSAFLITFSIGGLGIFILRFRGLTGTPLGGSLRDWKTLTVFGIIILSLYALIILAGTSMPIITSFFMKRAANVTEAYYNNLSIPFGMFIIILMSLATTMAVAGKKPFASRENAIAAPAAVVAGVLVNIGHTSNLLAYVFTVLGSFLIARAIADLFIASPRMLAPSRLSHIGVGLLVLGLVTSNAHSVSEQKELVKGDAAAIGSLSIQFKGLREGKKSALLFSLGNGFASRDVETLYYFNERTESIYREPFILHGLFHDIYLAPETYTAGLESVTRLILKKGETADFSGMRILFSGFRTEHMTSGAPTTYADLIVNGTPLSPGVRFVRGEPVRMDRAVPGTDRAVSLLEIDATGKRILLHVAPGARTVIPPDTVIITVTWKRLIWLVWLGTICIAAGGLYAMGTAIRSGRKRRAE